MGSDLHLPLCPLQSPKKEGRRRSRPGSSPQASPPVYAKTEISPPLPSPSMGNEVRRRTLAVCRVMFEVEETSAARSANRANERGHDECEDCEHDHEPEDVAEDRKERRLFVVGVGSRHRSRKSRSDPSR